MATSRSYPLEGESRDSALFPVPAGTPARRIAKYDVQMEVGDGTLVRVFRAFDRGLGRPVTLKLLTELADSELTNRFRDEVILAGKLRTENFIAIYDLTDHAGQPCVAMQVTPDDNLEQAIRIRRPLSLLQKLLILWEVSEGLRAAHLEGLKHVGLRPSAIALNENGHAIIHDFGIVRLIPHPDSNAESYTAPEEVNGATPADSLCDIFVFGIIAYQLLTGKHPFPSEESEHLPLRSLLPDCPEDLEHVVHRALEKDRDSRYRNLDELREDFEPVLASLKRARSKSLLTEACRMVGAGELDQVSPVLQEVLQLDPDNRKAHRLRTDVRSLLQARMLERKKRMEAQLREAESLVNEQQLNRAIVLLCDMAREFRGEPQISDLMAQACEKRARLEAIAGAASACDELLKEDNIDQAERVLGEALTSYPGEPALIDRRKLIDARRLEIITLNAARKAIEEAQWLLDQDRADLAVQSLRERNAESPHPLLAERIAEVEALLPGWQKARFVAETLQGIASLEELQQWTTALTVVEEALQSHPKDLSLLEKAEQLRARQTEEEHRRRFGRRMEAIGQKMNAQRWSQALMLIEAALTEFPGEPELDRLRVLAEDGRRRSEAEEVMNLVRQCLEDRDPERADEILKKGLEASPADPALLSLQAEVKAARQYREDWRMAQVLFGRRQFKEAEQILVRLASPDRAEVELLLQKVREARAATEEDHFYTSGRAKALKLIQQQHFDQAADLLRNMLDLFPNDPILLRDLQSIQADLPKTPAPAVLPAQAKETLPPIPFTLHATKQASNPRRRKLAVIGASGALVLASASAAVWKISNRKSFPPPAASAEVRPPVSPGSATPSDSAAPIVQTVSPQVAVSSRPAVDPSERRAEEAAPRRAFSPPAPAPQVQKGAETALIAPPLVEGHPKGAVPALPDRVLANAPIAAPPPPPANPAPTDARAQRIPEPPPEPPIGGKAEVARLISGPPPAMPPLAQQLKVRGTVDIQATVDTRGMLKDVKVVSGHALLSIAARDAVLKWRYQPATLNGVPVESKVDIKVTFMDR